MCLLDLFKLHVTHKNLSKSKSYKSFDKITTVPRISQLYPEFLLVKVGEDSVETMSTTIPPESSGSFGMFDCSRFHNHLGTDDDRLVENIFRTLYLCFLNLFLQLI